MIGNKPIGEAKVDELKTNGLLGVSNSLAYRIHELERHNHSWERWFAKAAIPSGETHVADRISDSQTPFVLDGGNNTWGAWVQILGSEDLPVMAGRVKFDPHKIVVVDMERVDTIHLLQVAFGETAAAALTSGDYTELVFKSPAGLPIDAVPIRLQTRRKDVDTKVWARVWAVGQTSGTIDFFYGLHEYEG
jgi:hypothetical protein